MSPFMKACYIKIRGSRAGRFTRKLLGRTAAEESRADCIRTYAQRHNATTFVETGTYFGDTLWLLRNDFTRLYSIELDEKLFRRAQKRFSSCAHITLFHGDSGTLLKSVLAGISTRCLFWLDAHASGGVTSQLANKATPIEQEIEAILTSNLSNPVLLIDDVPSFTDGHTGYPTLENILKLCRDANQSYVLERIGDVACLHT